MERRRRLARRFAAALLALAVGVQSGAAIAIPGARLASSCCQHQDESLKCPCASCEHGRELEAGKPVLRSCGKGPDLEALAAYPAPVLAAQPVLPERRRHAPPPVVHQRLQEPPDLDVDTPPPLA